MATVRLFDQNVKKIQEIFPLEAFQAVAEYFLDRMLTIIPTLQGGGLLSPQGREDILAITPEQMKQFVTDYSQKTFDEVKDVTFPANMNLPRFMVSITDPLLIKIAKELKFPERCIPRSNLIRPAVWYDYAGKISSDEPDHHQWLYDREKNIRFKTDHIEIAEMARKFIK